MLFEALTTEARKPFWYVEARVPDTLDGRFAVLASLTAQTLVRLEHDGNAGNRASVALTERFVEVMESEHRELGLGDPTLGRTVRKLVSMLARRTDLWREASANKTSWVEAARDSLYPPDVSEDAVNHAAVALRAFVQRLDGTSLDQLERGKIA